jgi:iron(III) transport system permease protein
MNKGTVIILLLIISFIGVFLFYPTFYVFKEACWHDGTLSFSYFRSLMLNPITRDAIVNSLLLASVTTLLTIILAVPLAYASVRYRFPLKNLLSGLLLIPLVMPPFVGAVGMKQFLARFGSLNLLLMELGLISSPVDWLGSARFWGVTIVMALHFYPIMYLNVSAALANIDPSLEEAALNLGSSPARKFLRITLPLLTPGLFAGAILIFIGAFTDLGTPLIFEYRRVVPVQIFDRVTDIGTNPEGFALVVLVLFFTLFSFIFNKRLFGREGYQTLSKGGARSTEIEPPALIKISLTLFFTLVILLASLPHLSVILTSLREKWFMTILPESYTLKYYSEALGHKLTLPAIRNSIILSSLSTIADVIVGLTVAWLLTRKKFRGAELLDAVVMLPLAIPGIVLAFGYVASFADTPLNPRENPMPLLVIAYAMRRLPYMVRAAYVGFQQVSVTLEEAGMNLGSSTIRVLYKITVPLIIANIIAGSIMAFAFAMLEVSDSLILAIKEQFYPLTKAIYQLLGRIEDGPCIASALGVWAMVFLALSLLTANALLGKRMGTLFRI